MKVLLRLAVAFAVIAAVFLIMEMSADESDAEQVEVSFEDGIRVMYRAKNAVGPENPEYMVNSSPTMIDDSNVVWAVPQNPEYGQIYANGLSTGYNGKYLDLTNYSEGIHFEVFRSDYSISFSSSVGEGTPIDSVISLGESTHYSIPEVSYSYDWHHATVWNTRYNGEGEIIAPGEYTMSLDFIRNHYSLDNNVLVLYPVWLETQYSFSFSKNGGSGEDLSPTPDFRLSSVSVTIPEVSVTKIGYYSEIWNTASDGSGNDVTPGDHAVTNSFLGDYFETNDKVTLYPKWILSDYSFIFNSGEGVTGESPVKISDKTLGSEITIPSPSFTKIGYYWIAWSTQDGSNLTFFNQKYTLNEEMVGEAPLGKRDINLYPVWEPTVYRITLTTDRSSVNFSGWTESNGGFVREYTIESDDISLPAPLPDDRFHDFICWEDSGEKTVSVVSAGSYGDRTYKAVWNEREYTMNINVNGRIVSQRFTIGSSLESPEPEEGFVFKGWFYKDENGDEKQFSEMSQMTENMSIYAVFEPIRDDPIIIISAVAALISVFAAAMYLSFFRK